MADTEKVVFNKYGEKISVKKLGRSKGKSKFSIYHSDIGEEVPCLLAKENNQAVAEKIFYAFTSEGWIVDQRECELMARTALEMM